MFLLILENNLLSVLVVWIVMVIMVGIGLDLSIKIRNRVIISLGNVCMIFIMC